MQIWLLNILQPLQLNKIWYRERDDAVQAAATLSDQASKKAEDANRRHSKSCTTVKQLESDVAKLMSQVSALEHANRSWTLHFCWLTSDAEWQDPAEHYVPCSTLHDVQRDIMQPDHAGMAFWPNVDHTAVRKPCMSHPSVCNRLKEQQLKEAENVAAALNKGRESAEHATESARQAKQRMESELARMQKLVAELEHSKR